MYVIYHELVANGHMTVDYIPGKAHCVDIHTKALDRQSFEMHRELLFGVKMSCRSLACVCECYRLGFPFQRRKSRCHSIMLGQLEMTDQGVVFVLLVISNIHLIAIVAYWNIYRIV